MADKDCAYGDAASPELRSKGGRDWQIGTGTHVVWIASTTPAGFTITSAMPPVFGAYATIVLPQDDESLEDHEGRVLQALTEHFDERSWWLGYLDTGADDVVFPDVQRVELYAGWPYVLVNAGPWQARHWRAGAAFTTHCRLPDLMFPADHAWLLSALWDDDWWSVGGPASLIAAFVNEPGLDVRVMGSDQDATPPGHVAR